MVLVRPRGVLVMVVLALGATGCSGGGPGRADASPGWTADVNVVSRPVIGDGVTAVTGLRGDGGLETAVYDLVKGRRLWTRPATMVGRVTGMGVEPPAVVGGTVAALEPGTAGREKATLVVRDARTGAQRWTRPVDSTFGPVGCGTRLCVTEQTARRSARFVVLDPGSGRSLWSMPGIAEVEHVDRTRAVLFRMAGRPSLESRDLASGRTLWSFPVERAVGGRVNLSGGWAFGALTGEVPSPSDVLVGYLAPYRKGRGRPSASGFFGVRLTDGGLVWARRRLLRVYPSASPAVALIGRQVTAAGAYGGFEQLDPRTGRTAGTIGAERVPRAPWWVAFPADLRTVGFLTPDKPGTAYSLEDSAPAPAKGVRAWSFCTVNPAELRISGQRGFYPVAALCAYDLATGRRVASPGAPPGWYTGAVDGWRVWRDERGALHAVRDAQGTAPGMYGL
ncbi:outer membrane protein assembly factor BamB family protein [Actinomadura fibrosa]|uniref:PQQ-binding-like beta-propeller repeat protein n=1 Tax=Actinomadura fibrosa TaxID=111802 RepID=A0ABW2XGI8_9ACTN|nr:PQQ-binding-like beta-propeller repeat protein [Actinomadura fibrosa]